MKEIEQKADFVIDIYRTYIRKADVFCNLRVEDERFLATQCAILSVKHTLEVLELMKSEYIKRNYICPEIIMSLQEQTELLTELESRL